MKLPKHWKKWKSQKEKDEVINRWETTIKEYKREIKNTKALIKKLKKLKVNRREKNE